MPLDTLCANDCAGCEEAEMHRKKATETFHEADIHRTGGRRNSRDHPQSGQNRSEC